MFADYFKAINNPNDRLVQPDEEVLIFNEQYQKVELQVLFKELNVDISENEIMNAIKQLNVIY